MALRAQTQHGAVLADGGVPIRVEQYEVSCGEGDIPGRGEILARVVWVDAPDHRTDLLQYGNSETGSGGGVLQMKPEVPVHSVRTAHRL